MNHIRRLKSKISYCIIILISCIFYNPVLSGAVQLTNDNFDNLVAQYEVVFLNFYADWCRFSQILAPVFDEASDKITAEFPEPGKALFGKVDCDQQTALAGRFHISKYPTLKLLINGQVGKKEYRGQRSADALVEFVRDLLKDPVKELTSVKDTANIDLKYRVLFGYFESKDSPQYNTFQKLSKSLRDYCEFYAGIGDNVTDQRRGGDNILFRPSHSAYGHGNIRYPGNLVDFNELSNWATELCIPLVREITFENAEELTEEGLPFLILFHHPDDHEIVKKYTAEVKNQLSGDKGSINCLTADGIKFSHPLHHLGKTQKDLPLIAIDSFRHMYLFPDMKQLQVPGKLKQFIDDLYSGKLHREFHYGPDPTPQEVAHNPNSDQMSQGGSQATTPPLSTFKKLAPSKSRYTLLRDEL